MVARQRQRIRRVIPFKKLEGLELSRFTFCLSTQGRRKTRLPVETNGFILAESLTHFIKSLVVSSLQSSVFKKKKKESKLLRVSVFPHLCVGNVKSSKEAQEGTGV